MKKVFSLLAVLALVCMAGTAFAAFTPTSKTAIASFTGGDITFTVTFYQWTGNYEGDTAKDNIEWNNPSGVTIANPDPLWGNASVYALIHSEITTTGKVYMYTDNKNNSDPYKANTSTSGSFNGLVRGNSKGGAANNFAPLMYRSVSLTTAKNDYDASHGQPAVYDDGGDNYGKKFICDISSYGASGPDAQTKDYMKIATSAGIWIGYGENWENFSTEDCVLFFGAKFTNVLGGDTFGTNTLTFNTLVE